MKAMSQILTPVRGLKCTKSIYSVDRSLLLTGWSLPAKSSRAAAHGAQVSPGRSMAGML